MHTHTKLPAVVSGPSLPNITAPERKRKQTTNKRHLYNNNTPRHTWEPRCYTMVQLLPVTLLLAVRALNAFYSLIPDCDEVFNYYEPLNFLVRGFGKQTWEYSPEYTIRSWSYLVPYALFAGPLSFFADLFTSIPPSAVFYAIRLLIASSNVYAEYHLFLTLQRHASKAVANWFLLFTLTSTGMSHAAVTLLPSSLAMTCTTLATSNFIRYAVSTHSTRNALLVTSWFAIGGLLGWPFALALAVPSMIYIMIQSFPAENKLKRYINWSIAICAFYLVLIMEVDHYFYGRTVIVPLNIVFYNVIDASEETGPNIFGTEELMYYIQNLLLNFNVVAVLGYSGLIIGPLLFIFNKEKRLGPIFVTGAVAPIALWSGIFFSQPHKEERFLYPIYTLITSSAAVVTPILLTVLKLSVRFITRSAAFTRFVHYLTIIVVASLIALVSISRTLSLATNYNTPLEVHAHIPNTATGNVCVGREWYRFPSSFFLPPHTRLQFVESGFRGLLPGDFDESCESLPKAIQKIPEGMNNKNEYDSGKVVSMGECQYFIDIDEEVDVEAGEIRFVDDEGVVREGWELLYSAKFLNNGKSTGLGKLLYIPSFLDKFVTGETVYHSYNLYQRTGLDEDDTPEPTAEEHTPQMPVETGKQQKGWLEEIEEEAEEVIEGVVEAVIEGFAEGTF